MKGQKVVSCGPDTLHLTYREAPGRTPEELSQLLAEFNRLYEIPTDTVTRDRGLSGFADRQVEEPIGASDASPGDGTLLGRPIQARGARKGPFFETSKSDKIIIQTSPNGPKGDI